MLFERRCEVCWPCSTAEPSSRDSHSLGLLQVAAASTSPEYPTLNVHVQEPNDAAEEILVRGNLEEMHQKLATLASQGLAQRERMADLLESLTAQIEGVVHIADSTMNMAPSEVK